MIQKDNQMTKRRDFIKKSVIRTTGMTIGIGEKVKFLIMKCLFEKIIDSVYD